RNKLHATLGGGCEHPGHELSGHGRHRRRTILNGIKRLFKELLQARGRHYEQELCVHVAGVLKGMRDSAGEANKISGRCGQRLPADVYRQRPLLQVERLLLPVVNVRWVASARRDRYLGHEKGAAGFFAGDEKRNLIDGATIGLTGSRAHIPDLSFPCRRGGSIHQGSGGVAGASDRIGGGGGSLMCSHLSSP